MTNRYVLYPAGSENQIMIFDRKTRKTMTSTVETVFKLLLKNSGKKRK